MFRPIPESTFFRRIPYRLIAAVLLIVALALSALLLVSLGQEARLWQSVAQDRPVPIESPALLQSRRELIAAAALIFLAGAISLAAAITWLHDDRTKQTLEAVKGLARHILESIPTGVLTIDCHGVITAVNPAAEAILKRSSADLLGNTYESTFAKGEAIREVLDDALRRHRHASHKDLSYEGQDRSARTIRVSTAELSGDDGHLSGVILQAQDITDWLALEQRVRVADKLAALHTLSAGVAHELRNPLGAMDLNLHLLEEELRAAPIAPQAAHYLHVLNAECRRLSAILDNFMQFARPGAVRLHEVEIERLIRHIVALMQLEAEERKIRLDQNVEEGLPPVMGDETLIGQVLVNVVVNAFHAMPDGGVCRIAAGRREADGKSWVELSVQDTGIGIKTEDLSRLFEPFYTTKPTGNGLGLAIAYRIVQDHGGQIAVASTPGSGTTVTISLPCAVRQPSRETVGA